MHFFKRCCSGPDRGPALTPWTADGKHVRDFLLGVLGLGVLIEGYGSNLFTGLEILRGYNTTICNK